MKWLSSAISKLAKPSARPQAPVAELAESTPKIKRSTTERLAANFKQGNEAMSPRLLRRSLQALQEVIDPRISETEGGRRAERLASIYASSTKDRKLDFWRLMSEQFGNDKSKAELERQRYEAASAIGDELAAEVRFRRSTISPRRLLLQRFAIHQHGLQFLIEMRAELQPFLKTERQLAALDLELEDMLSTWCDISLLEFRAINWDSPASLIERLIRYEAVHDIRSWSDMKKRLEGDRRCYGFFHHRMAGIPLIFIEVALMNEVPATIAPVIDETRLPTDQRNASVAVFYSISNTQAGLRGIPFGDSLIKRVVEELANEFQKLKIFVTLSPMPGYRQWLQKSIDHELEGLGAKRLKLLDSITGSDRSRKNIVLQLPEGPSAQSAQEPETLGLISSIHLSLAARYLTTLDEVGEPIDPVARFHLGNGARIERINWAADPSAKGLKQAFGLMVNYVYDLKRLDRTRASLAKGKIVLGPAVQSLLEG